MSETGGAAAAESEALASLFRQGRLPEAETSALAMTQRYPHEAAGWSVLGKALGMMGRPGEALGPLQVAARLSDDDADAHNNLGYTFALLGRHQDAEASLRRALSIASDHVPALISLGAVLRRLGRPLEAQECFAHAIRIFPDHAFAHNNLANTYAQLGRLQEAEASYRQALRVKPDYAEAHRNLGIALLHMLRLEEAEACFRRAIEIWPDYLDAHDGLMHCLNFTAHSPESCRQDAQRYGQVAAGHAVPFASWQCVEAPARLKVGLVSGDLGEHAVGHFLEGVLTQIDPARIELIAYPTFERSDALAARIKPRFAAWKPVQALSDEAAARMIHADAVHILFELSGHTEHNRLPLFAWKPAPIQVSWLGHAATTGVAQVDYVLADRFTVPDGHEAQFTEKVWRLPDTRLCFTPPDVDVPVTQLPARSDGRLTFCCFNNISKLNSQVVALWARILAALPASRLLLKATQLSDPYVQHIVTERFAGQGVEAGRLILEGPSARSDYLAAYQRADIALDPFPFSGGTTSAEALWMGVPIVTMAGDRLVSRQGVGLLTNAGLSDWIASGAEEYFERTLFHASDLDRLAALRSRLRAQVLASPVFDHARFARQLEADLYRMWAHERETRPQRSMSLR